MLTMYIYCILDVCQGRVVQKAVSANLAYLKVNQSINFLPIKMFFTANVLCSLSLETV